AAENHDAQIARMHGSRQGDSAGSMGQRLAAEQGDALDAVLPRRFLDLRHDIAEPHRRAAGKGQHLRIAPTGTAQGTALKPQREAPSRSLRLGAGDNLRDPERTVRKHPRDPREFNSYCSDFLSGGKHPIAQVESATLRNEDSALARSQARYPRPEAALPRSRHNPGPSARSDTSGANAGRG